VSPGGDHASIVVNKIENQLGAIIVEPLCLRGEQQRPDTDRPHPITKVGGTQGDGRKRTYCRSSTCSLMIAESCRPDAGRQPRPALGIRLAYIREDIGRKAVGLGWPWPPELGDSSGSSLASGRQHRITRPVRRGWNQGTKVGRKESAVGESYRRRADYGPERGRDPRPVDASPAA
jgi:hypothetical protein